MIKIIFTSLLIGLTSLTAFAAKCDYENSHSFKSSYNGWNIGETAEVHVVLDEEPWTAEMYGSLIAINVSPDSVTATLKDAKTGKLVSFDLSSLRRPLECLNGFCAGDKVRVYGEFDKARDSNPGTAFIKRIFSNGTVELKSGHPSDKILPSSWYANIKQLGKPKSWCRDE